MANSIERGCALVEGGSICNGSCCLLDQLRHEDLNGGNTLSGDPSGSMWNEGEWYRYGSSIIRIASKAQCEHVLELITEFFDITQRKAVSEEFGEDGYFHSVKE